MMPISMKGFLLGWAECSRCHVLVYTWREAEEHLSEHGTSGDPVDGENLAYLNRMADWHDYLSPEQLAGKDDIGC